MGPWVLINAGWYQGQGVLGGLQSRKRAASGNVFGFESNFGVGPQPRLVDECPRRVGFGPRSDQARIIWGLICAVDDARTSERSIKRQKLTLLRRHGRGLSGEEQPSKEDPSPMNG